MMYLMHPPERKGPTVAEALEHAVVVVLSVLIAVLLLGMWLVSGAWRESD